MRNITMNKILECTIGRTSRATFGIPAKRLNFRIYPILGDSLFQEML